MSEGVLFDTCTLVWWTMGARLSPAAKNSIDAAAIAKAVYVSPFSAWEVGLLQSRGRSPIGVAVLIWYEAALELPGFVEMPLSASVLGNSWGLPGEPPNDPADRVLIATAREHGLTLITRDRAMLSYGSAGHVVTLEC